MFNLPRWVVLCAVAAVVCVGQAFAQVPDSIATALRTYESPVSPLAMVMARDQVFELDSLKLKAYEPSAVYDEWWKAVQKCSGLKSGINITLAWVWIATPGDAFMIDGVGPFGGYTNVDTHAVIVLEKYKYNKWIISHEMVHVLMHENNLETGHNPKYFEPCGLQNQ